MIWFGSPGGILEEELTLTSALLCRVERDSSDHPAKTLSDRSGLSVLFVKKQKFPRCSESRTSRDHEILFGLKLLE
jgi:hypothetical protein